ncbi:hypothetical protein MHYP_G00171380 [Metynnis hypsauchen]
MPDEPPIICYLSQEKVPLVCLSDGNINEHSKSVRTARRVKMLPAVPIIPKGPEPDKLTSYLRAQVLNGHQEVPSQLYMVTDGDRLRRLEH